MESISYHISTLLYDHNCVIVPSLGGFVANYQSAKIHPSSYIFNSPSKSLAFNVNLRHNDGLLLYHLVSAENIPVADAEAKIKNFVQEVSHNLSENRAFKLPDVGRLMKDAEGNIQFIPDMANNYLPEAYGLYSFTAEPVIRERKNAVKHIERIKIRPEEERRAKKSRNILLPAAAVLLLALCILQLFIQTNRKGYDMAEVFGIDSFVHNREYNVKSVNNNSITPDGNYLHQYRKTEVILSPVTELADEQNIQIPSSPVNNIVDEPRYYLIAGVFGKTEYAMTVIEKLPPSYIGRVLEKNGMFMVAVDIPAASNLVKYRDEFAHSTHIEDAWVLKNK